MKKITLSALFCAILLSGVLVSGTSFARKPSVEQPSYMTQLNKVIKESVKYPQFTLAKDERTDIYITFSLTDEGKVKVEKISGTSQRIEEYIREQLSAVVAKDIIHPYNQMYKVKFRFENS
jgi:hypothetical protein